MRRPFIAALAFTLLGINACWIGREVLSAADAVSICKYRENEVHELRQTARAALLALPALASDRTKEELVQELAKATGDSDPFEKDEVTVVGWIALRFAADGRLIDARSAIEPDIVFDVLDSGMDQ